jgi:hypothetical protein
LTASIAEQFLNPKTEIAIRELLPVDNLTTVSTWADQIKRNPRYRWTSTLHYVNPKDDEPSHCDFDYGRDCNDEKCIVGALFNFSQVVVNRRLDERTRTDALKFLVHFLGDIHQPLHGT